MVPCSDCNVNTELRTDKNIIKQLCDYSEIGSVRREQDDRLYMYLSFVNTISELKNICLVFKDDKRDTQ